MKKLLLSITASLLAYFSFAQTVGNTYTYKQITQLQESHVNGQDWQHVISDNGNKVTWYRQTNPKQVYMMNSDGSSLQSIVDMGTERLSQVDISADGSKVVYMGGPFFSGNRLNFINADGTGDTPLIELNELRMGTIKIAGDGSKAFFAVKSDASIISGGGAIERGIYSIGLDGTGLTQIIGPADVAGALGINASDVGGFSGGSAGPSFDISYDGTEVVCLGKDDANGGYYVFTTHNGITEILGPFQWLNGVGISADGSKIAASVNDNGNHEGWVADYNGGNLTMLASNADMFEFSNGNSLGDAVALTSDGSKVLFDSYGHLFNTDGSGLISVAAATLSSAGNPMIKDGVTRATMTSDGSRILFSFLDGVTDHWQMAILDINPPSMGLCPTLSDFYWNPNGAAPSPSGPASEIRLTVSPAAGADSIWYAGNVTLLDGLKDTKVYAGEFHDNGINTGDQTANDGIYTHNNIYAFADAELGPRTMRFNCETYDSDLMHYGTAVDVDTWYVADNISIDEVVGSDFLMYPNPANGIVGLKVPDSTFKVDGVEVLDALGRTVEVYPFVMNGQPMMNTSSWANGVYSISLTNNNGNRSTQKLIVQH